MPFDAPAWGNRPENLHTPYIFGNYTHWASFLSLTIWVHFHSFNPIGLTLSLTLTLAITLTLIEFGNAVPRYAEQSAIDTETVFITDYTED